MLKLLLRSWAYIRPLVLGRWWIPGRGVQDRVADLVSGDGYQFTYAPFLIAAVAVAGPLSGWVPASIGWPMNLLYVPVLVLVVCMGLVAWRQGRAQTVGVVGVLLSGIGIALAATFFIDGWASTLYGVAVIVAAIVGWMVQFRAAQGHLRSRVRVGTHLVYFYAINFLQRGIGLVLGVLLADLLNQNLLQAEPLAPALANLAGLPDWAQGSVESLTTDQRRELVWLYVYLALGVHLAQLPLRIINPYYNMWIMQRINQALRLALVERWHQLSLSYHSGHRTGDSIFRIYQDSAMVTAVIGHVIGMTLALGQLPQLCRARHGDVALAWPFRPRRRRAGPPVGAVRHAAHAHENVGLSRPPLRNVTSTIQESFGAIRLVKAFSTAALRPAASRGRLGDRVQRGLSRAPTHRRGHHRHVHGGHHFRRRRTSVMAWWANQGGGRLGDRAHRSARHQLRGVEPSPASAGPATSSTSPAATCGNCCATG